MSITTTTPMTAESPDRTPSPTASVLDTAPGEATLLWCFTQNQRDEVRLLVEKAGAVMANPGMKQQTYVVVLNDQGGAVMSVTENKTNTLRAQDHGHPPLIIIRKEHEPTERNDIRRLGDNESNQQEYAGVRATLPHSSQRQSEHCGDML